MELTATQQMRRSRAVVRLIAWICTLLIASGIILLQGPAMTSMAAAPDTASIVAAQIIHGTSAGTGDVLVSVSGNMPTDDGLYHIYAQMPYESGLQGTEVAVCKAADGEVCAFPLQEGTANSLLYKKFTVSVLQGGQRIQVGQSVYITNPEAIARVAAPRRDLGKKGILPDARLIDNHLDDLMEMGVHQLTYNVNVGRLFENGTIPYEYNGKTYYMSQAVKGELDAVIPHSNARGIQVTLILLNNLTSDQTLIHPSSRGHYGAYYYAFNTATQEGVEKLAAAASYLANRYNGGEPGTVDNWIIGNEANAQYEWNYMSTSVSMEGQAAEYAKAVRICYNAILSQNSNAKVYISLDHQYAKADVPSIHFGSRPYLEVFNQITNAEGNFDWNLAIHPYNASMYDAVAWTTSDLVTDDQNSPYITMRNVHIVTDLLLGAPFRNSKGGVRGTFCSEVGYNAYNDLQSQAASVVYGYLQCVNNQYIDGFIYSRQSDSPDETRNNLATGLQDYNYNHRMAYDFYKYADDPIVWGHCATIMGVNDISELIVSR